MQGKFEEKISECIKCPVFQEVKLKPATVYGIEPSDLNKNYFNKENCVYIKTLLELKPKVFEDFSKTGKHATIFGKERIRSQICLPLLTKNKIVGVLTFASDESEKFKSKQLSLLESIAYQIAGAIENASFYEKVRSEKIKLDAIFASMGEGIITTDKNNKIIAANKLAGEILGMSKRDLIKKDIALVYPKEKRDSVRKLIRQLKSGESLIKEIRIPIGAKKIRANFASIQRARDKFLGTVLLLQDITEKEYLYEKTKQAANKFSTLYEVSKVLSSTIELDELLGFIINCTVDTMGADTGSIMLIDKKSNKMKIAASKGLSKKIVEETCLKPGEGIAGWVFEKDEPLLLENIEDDSRFKGHETRKELGSSLSQFL
ncbi:GAF domain-containing protein [Candidatus Oleimmundimicrobium sp.]|uniref:GAF domain-containing protein n=1 Tax=Candidatus Oleimmundimicrobium sp. TaxID=3060597 RepID=UPI00280ABD04|nr:GAF domain-containing protein [Candidatus Oleimmundimicrobium sp.]